MLFWIPIFFFFFCALLGANFFIFFYCFHILYIQILFLNLVKFRVHHHYIILKLSGSYFHYQYIILKRSGSSNVLIYLSFFFFYLKKSNIIGYIESPSFPTFFFLNS